MNKLITPYIIIDQCRSDTMNIPVSRAAFIRHNLIY